MADLKDIELFEKHRRGSLSEMEIEAFENRLKSDDDFADCFRRYEQVIADIKQQQTYENLMVELDEVHKTNDWSAPTSEIMQSNKQSYGWLLCLLAVLAAATIAFFVARSIYSSNSSASTELPRETEEASFATEPGALEPDTVVASVQKPISAVEAEQTQPNPTAFMISESGYFVAQYSAIKTARSLRLRQNDTTEYKVKMLFNDPELDVAVLRLSEGSWPRKSRLPYRLATTQAFANTEVMAVARSGEMAFGLGHIKALESNGIRDFYSVELQEGAPIPMSGGALLSRNGNVVAFIRSADDSSEFVKSTELVGLLARHASDPEMADYLPAADNRLAGLEREFQRQKMEPFVLEVIQFY